MLRYRLDDLGAYQFEKLTQSALKASLGLGEIEAIGEGIHMRQFRSASPTLEFRQQDRSSSRPSLWRELTLQEQNPILP
jgi:hypothetical protein